MSFDKTIEKRIFGVTTQNSSIRLVLAGDSASGVSTNYPHPMRGTKVWDRAMFVLKKVSVAGGATGGSYTITFETDDVAGLTGLPIARISDIGPNSAGTIIFTNLHQSPGAPRPTHAYIDQTAAGGGITCDAYVIAKKYRGMLGNPGGPTSERILEGTMVRGASVSGGYFKDSKGWDASATFAIGTSASNFGMHRMRLWDSAFFWIVRGNTIAGTGDLDIVAKIDGTTFSVATTGTGGAVQNVAGDSYAHRVAVANSFYGQCPTPTHIIWTEVGAGAGVSDPRVIMLAKSGRGSMSKT